MSYQSNSLFRKNKGGKINEEGKCDFVCAGDLLGMLGAPALK